VLAYRLGRGRGRFPLSVVPRFTVAANAVHPTRARRPRRQEHAHGSTRGGPKVGGGEQNDRRVQSLLRVT
jgi:hypothetical protein